MTSPKVIVGMSGGVDSSVAALLLQQQGYAVEGLFMVNWQEDEEAYCSAADDLQDARRVCDVLGIPLHQVDFSAQYRAQVFDYFLAEYRAGRTPNPDVLCNREIKFGTFYDYARRLDAGYIATGHYARVEVSKTQVQLLRGRDTAKDQSYFLHQAPSDALRRTLFPLGQLTKNEVRNMAFEHGLHNHARRDSTGICFIGERPFKEFLSRYLPAQPGDIVTDDDTVVGRHDGLMFHTLGQRQGLGVGGLQGYPDGPWYVVHKDIPGNRLIIGQDGNHPLLLSRRVVTGPVHWVNQPGAGRLQIKIRYRQKDQDGVLTITPEGGDIQFDSPQRAVAPGQFAVFYDGEQCLGGAVIESYHSQ
ncbi:MAG: tRNA 2-thiouridine(34) synthase MnmA [Gammaproteobacteria bacterium]|nr:tRNA 2-thiouridine(34) synthase MnmA [Gammaproteobacteria bacterium]